MSHLEVLVAALEKHSDHLAHQPYDTVGGDYVIVGELTVTDVIMALASAVRAMEAQQH